MPSALIEVDEGVTQVERREYGAVGMIGVGVQLAVEQHHDFVAHILVDDAARVVNHVGGDFQIGVEQFHHLFGAGALAQNRVGGGVDEHAGHFAAFATQRQPRDLLDIIDHARWQIARHQFERFFVFALFGQVVQHDGDALCFLRRVLERAELQVDNGIAAFGDIGVCLKHRRLVMFADGANLLVKIGDARQNFVQRSADGKFGRRHQNLRGGAVESHDVILRPAGDDSAFNRGKDVFHQLFNLRDFV